MKLSKVEFNEIFNKVPRLCIEIAIVKDNKVLLALRRISPGENMWHLPGGTVFFEESVINAVHRFARKELNVKINIIKFLGYCDWETNKNAFGHAISLVFQAEIVEGQIKTDFQSSKAEFFSKLPQNTLEENKQLIREKLNIL